MKEKAEKEISEHTQGSLSNAGKTGIGYIAGQAGLYFMDTCITGAANLLQYGMRFASSIILMGGQVIIASGYGGYKMYSNGEKILNIYKEKYFGNF